MSRVLGAMLLMAAVLVGCGSQEAPVEQPAVGDGGASTPTCAAGAPDCGTVVEDPGGAGDQFDVESARAEARALLGTPESELDGSVRVGRRGDEQMMLTEDYVLGRMTVELDERHGEFRVTSVTVELPDGPETFRR